MICTLILLPAGFWATYGEEVTDQPLWNYWQNEQKAIYRSFLVPCGTSKEYSARTPGFIVNSVFDLTIGIAKRAEDEAS